MCCGKVHAHVGQKIAKSRNPASPQNLVKWLPTRARVGKIRFFDQPYNPRMLTQLSLTRTNPGKAEAKLETGGANTLRNVRGSSLWPLDGLSAIRRMLGRLSKGFQLASPVWVRGAKLMGAIRRLWSAPAVTGVRASVRGRQKNRSKFEGPESLSRIRETNELVARTEWRLLHAARLYRTLWNSYPGLFCMSDPPSLCLAPRGTGKPAGEF